jgi:hypothetical protein
VGVFVQLSALYPPHAGYPFFASLEEMLNGRRQRAEARTKPELYSMDQEIQTLFTDKASD